MLEKEKRKVGAWLYEGGGLGVGKKEGGWVGEVCFMYLLAVEDDLLGLDLAVLDLHLVSGQHDGDVLAHAGQVLF